MPILHNSTAHSKNQTAMAMDQGGESLFVVAFGETIKEIAIS